jgi:hypothetical protein
MYNKRGWIRITEAVVAILIMASVLIVIYTNEAPQVSYTDYVYDLQVRLLMDVADNPILRNATLFSNTTHNDTALVDYFDASIPTNFNYRIYVCNLSAESCNLNLNITEEVYVEDRIISSNLQKYEPKLLRLYIWEKR